MTLALNNLDSRTRLPDLWGDHSMALLRLDRWLWTAQKIVDDHYDSHLPNLVPSRLEMSDGRRYIRVDKVENCGRGNRTVYAFVDKATGDVLRAATYKAPAKHARGNLFDSLQGTEMLTPYGVAYLG